jgi:hypothetical protein
VSALAAILTAVEAIEDGDLDYALAVLRSALEGQPGARRHTCRCGAAFEWPGELERHQIVAHTPPVLHPAPPPRRILRAIPGGRR